MDSSNLDFTYMTESLKYPLLNCPVCQNPYIEPVTIEKSNRRLCRSCALLHHHANELISIQEPLIHRMLDDLLVRCKRCQQENIRRGDFSQHLSLQCSQRMVSCAAADLKCPWKGYPNEFDHHTATCPFQTLRPILSALLNENLQSKQLIEQYQHALEQQSNAIEQLRHDIQSQLIDGQTSDQIEKIQRELDESRDSLITMENTTARLVESKRQEYIRHDLFDRDLLQLKAKNEQLQEEIHQHAQQLSTRSNNQFQQDLKRIEDQIQQQIKRNYQLEKEFQHMKIGDCPLTMDIPQDGQSSSEELLRLKYMCNKHDVQIQLLARKRCAIVASTIRKEPTLEKLINRFPQNGEIDLNGKQVTDDDMQIIVRKALIEKNCVKLLLEKNDLTAQGATTLAYALCNNTSLSELFLSRNGITDVGVQVLAQTLAISNCALTRLDLHENNLTDESAEYLAEMLKTNRTLLVLGLDSNKITDDGVKFLLRSIAYFNRNLEQLSLSSNSLITEQSIETIEKMFEEKISLIELRLNNCNFTANDRARLRTIAPTNDIFTLKV